MLTEAATPTSRLSSHEIRRRVRDHVVQYSLHKNKDQKHFNKILQECKQHSISVLWSQSNILKKNVALDIHTYIERLSNRIRYQNAKLIYNENWSIWTHLHLKWFFNEHLIYILWINVYLHDDKRFNLQARMSGVLETCAFYFLGLTLNISLFH